MTEEEREDEAIIPEEDFREAIAACCEDPLLKRYFRLAPPGAKLFIGLGFYSTHFGDKVDPRQYAECQAEIEPALTANDLKYLIRFEDDKATKSYLRKLLARREKEAQGGEPAREELLHLPVSVDAIPVPRRRHRKGSSAGLQWFLRKDAIRWLPLLCKAAALVAVLIGGTVFVVLNWDRLGAGRPDVPAAQSETPPPQMALAEAAVVTNGAAAPELPIAPPPLVEAPPPAVPEGLPPAQIAPTTQVAKASAPLPVAEPTPETDIEAAADDPKPTRKRPRIARVVFTDGRKIIRHSGGKVEVPRVFSCVGAGIKPFWVYGPHPEIEAEKERKARREWRALVEQAQARDE